LMWYSCCHADLLNWPVPNMEPLLTVTESHWTGTGGHCFGISEVTVEGSVSNTLLRYLRSR
jgi:hypothetical protein